MPKTVTKTIDLSEQDEAWIQERLASGAYASESDLLSDLIHREQDRQRKVDELRALIQEGIDSGLSDISGPELMEHLKSEMRARGKL